MGGSVCVYVCAAVHWQSFNNKSPTFWAGISGNPVWWKKVSLGFLCMTKLEWGGENYTFKNLSHADLFRKEFIPTLLVQWELEKLCLLKKCTKTGKITGILPNKSGNMGIYGCPTTSQQQKQDVFFVLYQIKLREEIWERRKWHHQHWECQSELKERAGKGLSVEMGTTYHFGELSHFVSCQKLMKQKVAPMKQQITKLFINGGRGI